MRSSGGSNTYLLEVVDLRAGYGKAIILDGVSLRLREGELIAIVGPNGAGKSTLLRAILNLTRIHRGNITFREEDITNLSQRRRGHLGISLVPQSQSIFPKMTVKENLMVAGHCLPKWELTRSIQEEFERFPVLGDKQKQPGGTLSGGERQMLAISCGLVSKPTLLLLDEPSMGLAPMLVSMLMSTLKSIQENGTSIILVEQKPKSALEVADYAYLLESGLVKMEGNPDVFLCDTEFVKNYLGL